MFGAQILRRATVHNYRARVRAFDHEKLEVYQVGLDFVVLADGVVHALPRGRSYLADQLRRAATSIYLNIAEGSGEFSVPDKVRFYRMAKRSATECAAIIDVLTRLSAGRAEELAAGRDLLFRVVSMLTRMAQRTLERAHAPS
jgi:four helix bundle protein